MARPLRRRRRSRSRGPFAPAPSTRTGILHRHGLVLPAASLAATPLTRCERPGPNPLWQVDFKGHFALNPGRCHPLGVRDDHSRHNVLRAACADQKEGPVPAPLAGAFRRHGLPDQLLWDNGSPWGSGGEEHTALEAWVLRLGVRASHGRAYHPRTQGKEERCHRTLQAEVLARGGWTDCAQVQRAFDEGRPVHNTQRPHEALALAGPVSRYQPSARSFPETLPPVEYAGGVEVRRADVEGRISCRNRAWKVGRAFAGQPMGLCAPRPPTGCWRCSS